MSENDDTGAVWQRITENCAEYKSVDAGNDTGANRDEIWLRIATNAAAYIKAVEAERNAFLAEADKREVKGTITADDLKGILDAVAALPVEQQCRSYIPVEQGGTGAMLPKPVPEQTTEEKQ